MHHIEILFHNVEDKYYYPLYREGVMPSTEIEDVKAMFLNMDKTVQISTHSEMVILTIVKMVREGEINYQDLRFTESWREENGELSHNELRMDVDGEFTSNFLNPCHFFDWRYNLLF